MGIVRRSMGSLLTTLWISTPVSLTCGHRQQVDPSSKRERAREVDQWKACTMVPMLTPGYDSVAARAGALLLAFARSAIASCPAARPSPLQRLCCRSGGRPAPGVRQIGADANQPVTEGDGLTQFVGGPQDQGY